MAGERPSGRANYMMLGQLAMWPLARADALWFVYCMARARRAARMHTVSCCMCMWAWLKPG